MATIPDKNFREALSAEGWIVLGEEDNSQCEILEKGLKKKTLIETAPVGATTVLNQLKE